MVLVFIYWLTNMIDMEREIEAIILQQPINLTLLRSLSRRRGGFQNNSVRIRVWPKLMDVNRYRINDFRLEIDPHRDDSQVQCDVERSLWNIEVNKNWKDSYRERRRKALSDIIMAIMCRNKGLHYYQGFHDVVSVFLLVFQDDHLAFAVSERVALSYLVDFMQKDFEIVSEFMCLVLMIVKAADPVLYNHLHEANLEPFFATSWLITWLSHDIKSLDDIARLFDVLLSSPPIYIYYLSSAYILHLRKELLGIEPDFAMMHAALVRAPENFGFPVEDIILSADKLMLEYGIDKIKNIIANKKLLKLIDSKRIMSVARPCFNKDFADSDWTLLENMRLLPEDSWPFVKSSFRVLWNRGWNLTFLATTRTRIMQIEEKEEDIARRYQNPQKLKLGFKRKSALSVKPSMFDYLLGAMDEVMFVLFYNFRLNRNQNYLDRKNVISTIRMGLFWSFTFAMGGTLAYSWWNNKRVQNTCASGMIETN